MAQENFSPMRGETARPGMDERWDELRSKISKEWPQLSKDDLKSIGGDSRKLIALVHQKTGADISDIENRIDSIAEASEGLMSRVTRSVQEAVSSASQQVGEPLSQAYAATREQIASAPAQSAGIAFGVGVLLGLCAASLINDAQAPPRRTYW